MQQYIEVLKGIGKIKIYKKDNILFYEGELPNKLFVLLEGKIKLYKMLGERESILHFMNKTGFIAEMPSFMSLTYPANAMCMQECRILEVGMEELKDIMLKNGEFCLSFIASLCQKIRILESHISKSALSLEERLLDFISNNNENLENMSQKSIAFELNTSAESLSRVIKKLKNKGILSTKNGKIIR